MRPLTHTHTHTHTVSIRLSGILHRELSQSDQKSLRTALRDPWSKALTSRRRISRRFSCVVAVHSKLTSELIFENVCRHEGMVTNHLCRIVVGISSLIGRDGHRDMGAVSTYGKIIRNLLGSMKPSGSNLCADTRRYRCLRASQRVKTERDLHWVERGLTFWILGSNPRI